MVKFNAIHLRAIFNCVLIWFIFFLYSTHSYAQEKVCIHYKIEDGLLSNRIYTIKQDKRGFIWIATDNGLCRYDGQRFKRYSTLNGLPDNDILGIEIDAKDRVWVTTYNRNLCYIHQDKIVTNLQDTNLANHVFVSYISLIGRSNNYLYFNEARIDGRYRIDTNGFISKDTLNSNLVFLGENYIRYNKSKIQLCNMDDELLSEVKLDSNNFNRIELIPFSSTSFNIRCVSGFYRCDLKNDKIIMKTVDDFTSISPYYFFRKNQLWGINNQNYLAPLNKSYSFNSLQSIHLSNVTITEFFIDDKGGYWVGTKGDGLYYYPNISLEWFNEVSGLKHPNITSTIRFNNEIYLVSSDSRIEKITKSGVQEDILDVSSDCRGVVNSLYVNDDYIVCGSDIGQLYVYSKRTKSFYVDPSIGSIKDIKAFRGNTILLATSAKLQSYNLENRTGQELIGGRSTRILVLNDSLLITGGVNKILLHNYSVLLDNQIQVRKKSEIELHNTTISDIQKFDSLIVIGTIERGLIIYCNGELQQVTVRNGLSDNLCKKIQIDSSGIVWISTMTGINILKFTSSIHDFSIQHINTTHGLVTNNISSVQRIGNNVYASTSKGVLKFPFNLMAIEHDTPKVYISEVFIRNKKVAFNTNKVTIPADSNFITIEFSAIDYKSLGNITYYYRLKGMNEYWQKFNKVLSIERLKPGEYELEVRAVNTKNITSIANPILRLEVLPYWWQRAIFKWFLFIGLAILVYVITRIILNRQYKKKLEEESMKKHLTEIELIALKAQINPHFIFNTLNAIQYFIQNNENEKADLYLNKMSKLIRSTLNYSNEASIPLVEEIAYLRTYLDLESLRFDESFRYEIIENYPVTMDSFMIPTMVLQPHVENAIRHGLKPKKKGTQELILRFYIENMYLVCEVDDNGIGREQSMKMKEQNQQLHNSQGMTLSNSKLDIYKKMNHKDVFTELVDKYQDGKPTGTTLKLSIHL